MCHGLVGLAPAGQRSIKVVVGVRVVGLDRQGPLKLGNCLVKLPAAGQRSTNVVVGFGVVGLEFQGLPIMCYRLVELAPRAEALPRLL